MKLPLWPFLLSYRLTPLHRFLSWILCATRVLKPSPLTGKREIFTPLFVVGSGRSGSTLLRALLVAQGEFSIPPESYVLPSVIRTFHKFGFLPWEMLVRIALGGFEGHPQFHTWDLDLRPLYSRACAIESSRRSLDVLLNMLYRYYGQVHFPAATRWGDKTPLNTLHLDVIQRVFPRAQYIHVLRDGRDVVASYLESRIYTDIERAARRWVKSVLYARQLGRRLSSESYLEVRYESLVSHPEAVGWEICSFLKTEYRSKMLEFWKLASTLGDTQAPHHASVYKPINTDSIGLWRTSLSSPERRLVEDLIGHELEELGY